MNKTKAIVVSLFVSLGLTLSTAGASGFTLHKRSAQPVDFQSLVGDGRWTLVMLWAIDCVPCEAQKPMIDSFHASHVDSDARVVGIALDGLENIDGIEKVIRKTPTRFPHYVADAQTFHNEFQVRTGQGFRATPTYLLFDPDGRYAATHVGVIDRAGLEAAVGSGV